MHYTSREVYEYISKQTNDPIVEWKTCTISGQPFPIYQSDREFYDKISPTFAGQKFPIEPTLCPEERNRRRLSFRNERKLYRRTCDASKQPIISIYSPDKPYKVYDAKIWWSDSWDASDYGRDFDFSKSFTENFRELMFVVPRLPLYATQNEHSDYVNGAAYNKNCYLIFASDYNENCLFMDNSSYCNHSLDLSDSTKCDHGYQLIGCGNCIGSSNCINCFNSHHCQYCFDCHDCDSCFLSHGLKNKQYHFRNQPYTREQYLTLVHDYLQQHTNPQAQSDFSLLKQDVIHNSYNGNNNESSSGNFITNCNHSQNVFSCHEIKYCKNIINGTNCSECYDSYVIIDNSQLCYENVSSIGLYSCVSTMCCWNINQHLYYCDHCQSCQNCFGCIGLRNKQYCIFNKQYSKEEYEIQVAKIITHMQSTGEWGEFFHPSLSPFGYNETVTQEYFPLQTEGSKISEEPDLKNSVNFGTFGYKRSNYSSDPAIPSGAQTIERKNYNDEQRSQLKDDPEILNKILICEISSRPYKLQKAELEFYRKHNLPIPSKHSDIRHEERVHQKPSKKLNLRHCDYCHQSIISVYPQDHEGKVYCESCYQKEVFG